MRLVERACKSQRAVPIYRKNRRMSCIKISIIIPAHNEARRLRSTLRRYTDALTQRCREKFELIVVVDGSSDGTVQIATNAGQIHPQIRVIEIPGRAGKGGTVLAGFSQAAGERVVVADADASTAPASLLELVDGLDRSDIVIGSRRLPNSTITARRPPARRILSLAFFVTVHTLFNLPYRDTQCGAKAFTRRAARVSFREVSETGWTFGVDLLLAARRLGLSVEEHPAIWTDSSGSRVRLMSTLGQVRAPFWRLCRRSVSDYGGSLATGILDWRES
jgi:glycosyltransferase involved in cell wall biosynthesis